jgi:hypothetical protein
MYLLIAIDMLILIYSTHITLENQKADPNIEKSLNMLMNYAEICQKEINKLIVIYLISEYQ